MNVRILLDNDPINKLHYIPPKTNKDGVVTHAAQWFGYCKRSNKKVPLDELFVKDNFPEHLIADVKTFGEKGEKKYIPIPPGEAKPCSSFPDHLLKGPPMKYKQKEDQNTCLVFSFASVL